MGAMPLSELFQILFSLLILKTSIVELGNHEMIPFGNKIMENRAGFGLGFGLFEGVFGINTLVSLPSSVLLLNP